MTIAAVIALVAFLGNAAWQDRRFQKVFESRLDKVDSLDSRVTGLEANTAAINQRITDTFGELSKDVRSMTETVQDIDKRLARIEAQS